MNARRILLAGLLAGLLINVLDFITNAVIFGATWAEVYKGLGRPETPAIPIFWISFDFVAGVIIAFLYAAMRPRFGAGPKAAIVAGLIEWLICHLTLASHLADGLFPPGLLLGTGALELVSALAGALVAGRLYREVEPAARSALGAA